MNWTIANSYGSFVIKFCAKGGKIAEVVTGSSGTASYLKFNAIFILFLVLKSLTVALQILFILQLFDEALLFKTYSFDFRYPYSNFKN